MIIEILDHDEFRRNTWAIQPDEPVVGQCPHIRGLMLKQLAVDEVSDLESMSILRRGTSERRTECPFTIVLTAPEVYGLMMIRAQF